MGALLNWRRRLELLVVAFIALFAFASQGDQWIGWVRAAARVRCGRCWDRPAALSFEYASNPHTLTHTAARNLQATFGTMFSVIIMVDFMFLDDSAFIFDPDVKVRWRRRCCWYRRRCAVTALALLSHPMPPLIVQNWARRTTPQY